MRGTTLWRTKHALLLSESQCTFLRKSNGFERARLAELFLALFAASERPYTDDQNAWESFGRLFKTWFSKDQQFNRSVSHPVPTEYLVEFARKFQAAVQLYENWCNQDRISQLLLFPSVFEYTHLSNGSLATSVATPKRGNIVYWGHTAGLILLCLAK